MIHDSESGIREVVGGGTSIMPIIDKHREAWLEWN
jgi:hypothetical protein